MGSLKIKIMNQQLNNELIQELSIFAAKAIKAEKTGWRKMRYLKSGTLPKRHSRQFGKKW